MKMRAAGRPRSTDQKKGGNRPAVLCPGCGMLCECKKCECLDPRNWACDPPTECTGWFCKGLTPTEAKKS